MRRPVLLSFHLTPAPANRNCAIVLYFLLHLEQRDISYRITAGLKVQAVCPHCQTACAQVENVPTRGTQCRVEPNIAIRVGVPGGLNLPGSRGVCKPAQVLLSEINYVVKRFLGAGYLQLYFYVRKSGEESII